MLHQVIRGIDQDAQVLGIQLRRHPEHDLVLPLLFELPAFIQHFVFERSIDLVDKIKFSLLELLLRRQGEVLPKSLIASQVWDMNFDSDTNIIEVAIRRLRLKVDDPFPTKLIHTVRGMGYVLEERSH